MADNGRGAGGAGWFVVGLVIGVIGTLVTQRFVQSGAQTTPASTASSAAVPASSAPVVSDAKPKLVLHQGGLSGAKPVSAAAASAADEQNPDDIADDAAAAGATSRKPHSTPSN